ncbi:MAG: Ig-like domain-containing protein [Muribaculaceae bacterium]|nr:Ig-like domain-containing protein [Muribaculaceae bacterium]
MCKKLLQIFGLIFLLIFTTGITNAASVIVDQDNIRYTVDTDAGTAEVYGPGSSSTTITDLVIPDYIEYNGIQYPVTSIRKKAFYYCTNCIGSLTIGNSTLNIGESSFMGCSGFNGVLNIGNSVSTIGSGAFCDCSGFTGSLTIPNSVINIGTFAFQNCSGFTGSLIIGSSVVTIGRFAFQNCSGFTGSLIIPNSVTSIMEYAFNGCSSLTGSLTIGTSVNTISHEAFADCSGFTGPLTFPNSVTTIGGGTFSNCYGFTGTLTIPNSVSSIGDNAFSNCRGFDTLYLLPQKVENIDLYAFRLTAFKEIHCKAIVPLTTSGNSFDTWNYENSILNVPRESLNAYKTTGEWEKFKYINPISVASTSISLNKSEIELTVGQSETLMATLEPEDATDEIQWSVSANPDGCVTVVDGKVTAIAVGTATVTATAGEHSASCKVTVKPIVAESITLTPTDVTLLIGSTSPISAEISPANTTDKSITYSYEPEGIAVVENGIIKTIAVGQTVITATCGEVSATCKVTVNPVVASGVTINTQDMSLLVGQSDKLTATILPENTTDKTVTWKSSDESIAKVSEDGTVTAVSVGVATITATCGEVSATCKVTVNPVVASSVTINTQDMTLLVGQSDKLTATVLPENTTDKTIIWKSSDESIVKVSEDGTVTAVSVGVATITATCGDVSATCKVTVNPVVASGVTINTQDMTLLVGQSDKLTATVLPENTTDKTLTWMSSDESIAIVGADGTVTAISVGVATITATCGEVSANCKVTVNPVVASGVTLNVSDITLLVGQSDKLTATVLPENTTDKTVTWKSSDESIAKVSEDGTVTAVSVGVATITATCGEVLATCKVTVNPVVASSVNLNVQDMTLLVGQIDKLTATVLPENTTDKTITWKSSDESIANVSEDGTVTAVSVGVATITATCGDVSATCKVTVNPVVASSITINAQDVTLLVGQTDKLIATVLPENTTDATIIWRSSDESIAIVSADGTVTAISVGIATITATCGEVSATCKVTVNPVVASGVTINTQDITLLVGQSDKLTATVLPENTTDKAVTWKSSDEAIAKVSEDGTVTAVSVGVATITATCGEVSATCKVTVNPVVASGVTLNVPDMTLLVGQTDKLTATVLPENTTDQTITWKSSDESIATVSADGTVIAISVGVATITATCGEVSATCKITVNPVVASSVNLNVQDMTLLVGQSDKLTATILPENTTDKTITWTSDKPEVATVSEDGTINAVAIGVANITATCGEVSATCKVTVKVEFPMTSLELEPAEISMAQNALPVNIKPVYSPDNASMPEFEWSSSDAGVAKVDAHGTVSPVAQGEVVITCRALDGSNLSATCTVTVTAPIDENFGFDESIMGGLEGLTIYLGESVTIAPVAHEGYVLPDNIAWRSSNESIATVDQVGKVTGVGLGTSTITAFATINGKTVEVSCNVNVIPVKVSSIELSATTAELRVTETLKLTTAILPENATDKTLQWTTNAPSIASVTEDGMVTALQLGQARITARATDGSGVTASCTVKVIPTIATGITLTADGSTTLRATETVQLTAIVMPETTTDKTVTWKSDKPAIVTVNESGVVTAISVGEAMITATNSAGQTAEITITVIPTPVESIELNRYTAQLKVQEGFRLTANVLPATATDKSIVWNTSDPNIVEVDSDGNVLAVGLGNAIITCEAQDGSEVTAQCRVTVTETSTQSVTITADGETTLKATETVQLTATVLPATATDKSIIWQSDNTDIAEVDSRGLVTAISVGEATITATNSGGQTASISITVIPTQVEAIELSKTTATLKATESIQLIATVMPETATNKAIEWSSDNEDVATVTQSGLATAATVGRAIITAKAVDGSGVTATCTIDVIATEVTNLSITANGQTTLKASETVQLTANVLPETATDKSVIWTANAPEIANVNENGLVTAYAVGQSVIMATSSSGLTAEITITVIPTPVTSIIVNQQSVTMRVSDETHLTATVLPMTATDKTVTWRSANPEVATVDADGNVKAIKEGQTAITCVANDGSGVSSTCIVNVIDTEVETIRITAEGPTSLKVSETVQLKATILPETSTDKSVIWNSADENIVTVDENGLVTAVSEGYTVVTATTSNGLKDQITITVVETAVTAITLNESSIVLMANESFSLIPDIQPLTATNKQLQWASGDISIATVSNDGMVTAVAVGETTITASATDGSGVTASCKVTVIPTPAESISITVVGETTLEVNQNVQLMAEVLPANATDKSVVWSSSNPAVATVTETGLVTAVSAGETVITATNSAGQYDRVTITVISKEPDIPEIPEVKADTPTQLLRKGDGRSHTFIAMMAQSDIQLEAMGYNYVFGYNVSGQTLSNVIDNTPDRYTHTTEDIYTDAANDFWVFAYYIEADGTIRVSSRRHLDGSVDDDFDPNDFIGFFNSDSKEKIIGIYTVDGLSVGTEISRLKSGIYIIKTTSSSYKILR